VSSGIALEPIAGRRTTCPTSTGAHDSVTPHPFATITTLDLPPDVDVHALRRDAFFRPARRRLRGPKIVSEIKKMGLRIYHQIW